METLGNKKVAKVANSNKEIIYDDNKCGINNIDNKNPLLSQFQETNGNEKLQKIFVTTIYMIKCLQLKK